MIGAGTWERNGERNAIKLEMNESWSLGAALKECKRQVKVLPEAQLDCKWMRTAVEREWEKEGVRGICTKRIPLDRFRGRPCRPLLAEDPHQASDQ